MAAAPPARSPLHSIDAATQSNNVMVDRGGYISNGTTPNMANNAPQRSSSYFPQMPATEDRTLANTITNSHHQNHHHPGGGGGGSQQAGYDDSQQYHQASGANGKFTEEWNASQRGSSIIDGPSSSRHAMHRSNSFVSSGGDDVLQTATRSNTLKKKPSMRRSASLKRSGSRRSMKAGSVRSLALQSTSDPDEAHSAFHCPVPTSANPTELLANRFQAWRKLLKDLITYFREVQSHYDHRSKAGVKLANSSMNFSGPPGFLTSGGVDDAMQILRGFNKATVQDANRAREIEEDVILALTGLRSDLHQKIKEIKNLSGDFKNSVDKEMEATRRAVKSLQDVLGQSELDSSLTTGKQDPYLLRLAVDRQLERQIDEENYLHQAYLNLESSGRELESIVVGEIQKAYNAYASILKREADNTYAAVDELRLGPIAMPKDREWVQFTQKNDQFVDPSIPIRQAEYIHFPGKDHMACQEIRAGLLERKSKYLKSYTAGWYVLSPTHLHEFKSADKAQAPIMSLYLPEQKLGSHSAEGGSSQKFILKGRQTGSMHRGHTWVFRAETFDTMMAWYEDIKALTEKTPKERSDFVRGHSRSLSRSSRHSMSSDGGVVDEDDDEPFSASSQVDVTSAAGRQHQDGAPAARRPQPGGRFPSDLQVNAQRGLQARPLSPSSVSLAGNSSRHGDDDKGKSNDTTAAAAAGAGVMASGGLAAGGMGRSRNDQSFGYGSTDRTPLEEAPSHAAIVARDAREDGVNPYTNQPLGEINQSTPEHGRGAMGGSSSAIASQNVPRAGTMADYTTSTTDNEMGGGAVFMRGRSRPEETEGEHMVRHAHEVPAALPAAERGRQPAGPLFGEDERGGEWDDEAEEASKASRPAPGRNDSVPTIANLHIPGTYPKTPMSGPTSSEGASRK